MMDVEVYEKEWQRGRQWYAEQGYVEGETLFIASEIGGLQTATIDETIAKLQDAIANY